MGVVRPIEPESHARRHRPSVMCWLKLYVSDWMLRLIDVCRGSRSSRDCSTAHAHRIGRSRGWLLPGVHPLAGLMNCLATLCPPRTNLQPGTGQPAIRVGGGVRGVGAQPEVGVGLGEADRVRQARAWCRRAGSMSVGHGAVGPPVDLVMAAEGRLAAAPPRAHLGLCSTCSPARDDAPLQHGRSRPRRRAPPSPGGRPETGRGPRLARGSSLLALVTETAARPVARPAARCALSARDPLLQFHQGRDAPART